MTLPIGQRPFLFLRRQTPPVAIILTLLFAVLLFPLKQTKLAIAFGGYGIILIQTRISFWKYLRHLPAAGFWNALLRTAVFFLPLPFLGLPPLHAWSWGVLAGLAYGLALQLWQLEELKLNFSKEFLAILPPLSRQEKRYTAVRPFLAAISQEYFYRGVLLYLLMAHIGMWSIVVSALLFGFEHVMFYNVSREFESRDILLQILLGLGLGAIFYFSQSLVACIVGHVVYNTPGALLTILRESEAQ